MFGIGLGLAIRACAPLLAVLRRYFTRLNPVSSQRFQMGAWLIPDSDWSFTLDASYRNTIHRGILTGGLIPGENSVELEIREDTGQPRIAIYIGTTLHLITGISDLRDNILHAFEVRYTKSTDLVELLVDNVLEASETVPMNGNQNIAYIGGRQDTFSSLYGIVANFKAYNAGELYIDIPFNKDFSALNDFEESRSFFNRVDLNLPELIINPNFEDGSNGWARLPNSNNVDIHFENNSLVINKALTFNFVAIQTEPPDFIAGHPYIAEFEILENYNGGSIMPIVGGRLGPEFSAVGKYKVTIIPTGSSNIVGFISWLTPLHGRINFFSVKSGIGSGQALNIPESEKYTLDENNFIGSENHVQNGEFSADINWSKAGGWIIENGMAVHPTGARGNLSQNVLTIDSGEKVRILYDLVGGIDPSGIVTYGVDGGRKIPFGDPNTKDNFADIAKGSINDLVKFDAFPSNDMSLDNLRLFRRLQIADVTDYITEYILNDNFESNSGWIIQGGSSIENGVAILEDGFFLRNNFFEQGFRYIIEFDVPIFTGSSAKRISNSSDTIYEIPSEGHHRVEYLHTIESGTMFIIDGADQPGLFHMENLRVLKEVI